MRDIRVVKCCVIVWQTLIPGELNTEQLIIKRSGGLHVHASHITVPSDKRYNIAPYTPM